MEQSLSVATFSNGEEDKRLVEGNNVGDEDIYDGICDEDSRFDGDSCESLDVIGCADRGESGDW